jgi:hypothetical protein
MSEAGEILSTFLSALKSGHYDEVLDSISVDIQKRKDFLKEEVRKQVKKYFGEDAEVVTPSDRSPVQQLFDRASADQGEDIKSNPFVEKAERESAPQAPPGSPPDPMQHLDKVEQEMELDASGRLPIEMRGAAISGLHSSQIGGN